MRWQTRLAIGLALVTLAGAAIVTVRDRAGLVRFYALVPPGRPPAAGAQLTYEGVHVGFVTKSRATPEGGQLLTLEIERADVPVRALDTLSFHVPPFLEGASQGTAGEARLEPVDPTAPPLASGDTLGGSKTAAAEQSRLRAAALEVARRARGARAADSTRMAEAALALFRRAAPRHTDGLRTEYRIHSFAWADTSAAIVEIVPFLTGPGANRVSMVGGGGKVRVDRAGNAVVLESFR